jgi:tetratricopeptide (TPR) repeat protein
MTQDGAGTGGLRVAWIAVALIAVIAAILLLRFEYLETETQAEDAMVTLERGIEQFQQKQYRQSLETLDAIPEGVRVWRVDYYMGSAHIMLREYESAAIHLENALAMNRDEPKILYALGVAYFKLGNLGLSKAYFGKVLEVDPGHDDARGLMDIVANLERRQAADPEPETGPADSHDEVSQPAETSPSGGDEAGSAH